MREKLRKSRSVIVATWRARPDRGGTRDCLRPGLTSGSSLYYSFQRVHLRCDVSLHRRMGVSSCIRQTAFPRWPTSLGFVDDISIYPCIATSKRCMPTTSIKERCPRSLVALLA